MRVPDGLEVCDSQVMGGRVMIATRCLEPGEVVFTEKPLARASQDASVSIDAFRGLIPSEQERFFDFHSEVREPFLSSARALGFGEAEAKVLSVWDLNAYETPDGRALFSLIALIPHGCAPNVRISVRDGLGEVTATARIEPSDVLCSWYPDQLDLFWCGALARRAHLSDTRGFECGCKRCAGPDSVRAFACHSCGGRVLEKSGRWLCGACGCELEDTVPLFAVEKEASQRVLLILESVDEGIDVDAETLTEESDAVIEALGDHHWIAAAYSFALHWRHHDLGDRMTAFTYGLGFLDWFRDARLTAPGYVLRRVFILGSRCFKHAQARARKKRTSDLWKTLVLRLAGTCLTVTDRDSWSEDRRVLAQLDVMKEMWLAPSVEEALVDHRNTPLFDLATSALKAEAAGCGRDEGTSKCARLE